MTKREQQIESRNTIISIITFSKTSSKQNQVSNQPFSKRKRSVNFTDQTISNKAKTITQSRNPRSSTPEEKTIAAASPPTREQHPQSPLN